MGKEHHSVIIAGGNPLFRAALSQSLRSIAPETVVVEADCFETLRMTARYRSEARMAVLDPQIAGMYGLPSLRALHAEFPRLRIAVVTSQPRRFKRRSIEALGVVACVPRTATPEQMREAWRNVLAGHQWWPATQQPGRAHGADSGERMKRLSPRELSILLHLKDGRRNRQIGESLGISEYTVRAHISGILHKLDVESRTQAALLAQQLLSAAGDS